jgi:UPF0755 protein
MKKLALALLLLMALSVIGAAGGYFFLEAQATASGSGEGAVEFEVPKGANAKTVAAQLESVGLVGDARIFRYVVWRRHGLALKAGKFSLGRTLSPRELADALEKPPLAEDEPFIVVEGWRIRDVDAALAAAGRADRGAYIEAAISSASYKTSFPLPTGSLEGYLYPETYRLPKGKIDPKLLVQEQLKQFGVRVWEPLSSEIKNQRRSLHELVTMASMLEREEPTPSNRPLVAGILWKRFDRRIPLGVDATSRYELDEWNNRTAFLQKLRDPSDPYNMRHNAGLPPTAIGAPTQSSFEAALRSQTSEFLYYLHDGEKNLHPSRNAQEHEALRKKYGVY